MKQTSFRNYNRALWAGGALVALTLGSAPAVAQSDDGEVGARQGDIVVTATRRDTTLRDIPLALAVQTGETLDKTNVASLQDLTKVEPALVVNNRGASSNQFIIRGIQSDIGSTTGFYLDESPLVGGGAVQDNGDGKPGLRLIDVSRIEVLKGPQGTLFGAGSMAGTLRIITNKPNTEKVEGGFDVTLASIKSGNMLGMGSGYINLPLSDKIAVRAVGWTEAGGGYINHTVENLAGTTSIFHDNVNDRSLWGGRLSMLIRPTEDFSLTLMATRQDVKVDGAQFWYKNNGAYQNFSPSLLTYAEKYELYSATAEYDLGFGTIIAAGNYAKQYMRNENDQTPTTIGLAMGFDLVPFKASLVTQQHFRNYTGELRFASSFDGPLQIVVGGYYENDLNKGTVDVIRPDDVTGALPCRTTPECEALGRRQGGWAAPGVRSPASDLIFARTLRTAVEQWAVYGQADWEIVPDLTATVGVRYYSGTTRNLGVKVQDVVPDYVGAGPPGTAPWITDPYVMQDDKGTEKSPTYNFSLFYKVTPQVSLFARAASGFRLGGTNDVQTPRSFGYDGFIPASFSSDKLWSYELGLKASMLDGALYLDTSVYQMDWSNQQLQATDPTQTYEFVVNAGKTRIRGVEAQLSYNKHGLTLNAGATYTNARLRADLGQEVTDTGISGYKGDRVPRVPRWTLSGLAEYEVPLTASVDGYIQVNANYRSSSTFNFNDENPDNEDLPKFALVNAKVGVRVDPVDISLFVENLTNKVAVYGIGVDTDGVRVFSPPPRTIGLRVSGRF